MPDICQYEAERNARIARNNEKMLELGLPELAVDFYKSVQRQRVSTTRKPKVRSSLPKVQVLLEKRRSGRLQLLPAPIYNEAALDKIDVAGSQKFQGSEAIEVYTEEHIKQLGDCKQEWKLFEDGYAANGDRIYDKVNGQTCHQCRQKTIGLRTECSSCQSLKGVFCGDCLYMRYGENILEAKENPSWTCPECRGICNCSIHRIRQGLAPTGSLYRQAIAAGYKSVAHMLILQNQATAEVQPPQAEAQQRADALVEAAASPGKSVKRRQKENDGPEAAEPIAQPKINTMLPHRRLTRSSKAGKSLERPALQPIGLQQQVAA